MNMRILDTIKIKIKCRNFDENPLAIATLNLNEEIEIRFAPILWKNSRNALFFNMPALKQYGYQKCVVILNADEYKKLQERVIQEFLDKAKDFYHPNELELIKKALVKEKEEEININEIPI